MERKASKGSEASRESKDFRDFRVPRVGPAHRVQLELKAEQVLKAHRAQQVLELPPRIRRTALQRLVAGWKRLTCHCRVQELSERNRIAHSALSAPGGAL
jgi:hypothetical protein